MLSRVHRALVRRIGTSIQTGRLPPAAGSIPRLSNGLLGVRLASIALEIAGDRAVAWEAGDPFAGLGKIAAIGVKVSRHRAYHGVALNVAMDLAPFERINPCGHPGLKTVDLSTIGVHATWDDVAMTLGAKLAAYLSTR